MGDLISRKSLLDNLNRFAPECYNALVNSLIKKEPAVDAVPVVRGEWYWADDGYCRCRNCDQKAPHMLHDDAPMAVMTYYCPQCGADMRKVEK